MKKLMILASAIVCSSAVYATVTWEVKTTQEANDISNAVNWPSEFASDKAVQFSSVLNNGHWLWMSQDLTVDSLKVTQRGDIAFDLGEGRTLNVNNGSIAFEGADTSMTLLSGTIKKTTKDSILIGSWGTNIRNTFTIDGADSCLYVRNGIVAVGTQEKDSHNAFVVQNGAVADLGDILYVGSKSNNRASSCNRGEIKGEGTCLYMTNAWQRIIVGNSYSAGGGASVSNVFSASDRAYVLLPSGRVDVGEGKQSNYNRAEIVDGAIADLPDICVGAGGQAYYNMFYASNATVNVSRIYVGYATNTAYNAFVAKDAVVTAGESSLGNYDTHSPSNRLEISGGRTTIDGSFYLGRKSSFCEGVFKDAADVALKSISTIGASSNAHSNRLEILSKTVVHTSDLRVGSSGSWNELVVDDASLIVTNASENGLLSASYTSDSSNNVIRIQNGGYVKTDRFHLNCSGTVTFNMLVLSNGVVEVLKGTTFYNPSNRFVFAGTNCVFRNVNEGVPSSSAATYTFYIPRGGYADAPLQSMNGSVSFAADMTIKLDISQFARGGGGKQVLARGMGGINITDAALASLNAQIAAQGLAGCSLSVVGKELVLNTPNTSGTLIIVK